MGDLEIKQLLDTAYRAFHCHYYRERDPVRFAHQYTDKQDQEVAAFLASLLAYGNVKIILGSVQTILDSLGTKPFSGIMNGVYEGKWRSFRHRFTTGEDLEIICESLRGFYKKTPSLEELFLKHSDPKGRMSYFSRYLMEQPLPSRLEAIRTHRARSLKYLLPDPSRGSACKRLNLFLRWMVRPSDGIDLGLWSRVSPAELMLPVDTHILKTIQRLGWTKHKQANWKTVIEATEQLRKYCSSDPVRYDFSLCHLSISGFTLEENFYEKVE